MPRDRPVARPIETNLDLAPGAARTPQPRREVRHREIIAQPTRQHRRIEPRRMAAGAARDKQPQGVAHHIAENGRG